MNNNINDNIKNFSDIFTNSSLKSDLNNSVHNNFITTEKWLLQLGRRITS